jgi:hypothetical protein
MLPTSAWLTAASGGSEIAVVFVSAKRRNERHLLESDYQSKEV